jgi:hypothetical protein
MELDLDWGEVINPQEIREEYSPWKWNTSWQEIILVIPQTKIEAEGMWLTLNNKREEKVK